MQYGNLFINQVSVTIPPSRISYRDAARRGLVESPDRSIGNPDVPIFDDTAHPVAHMAVDALKECLTVSSINARDVSFLIHCAMWHQGYDIWSAAHYVANEANATTAIPVNLGQGCNGTMAALELLCRSMVADSGITVGAITAADAMLPPLIDRWNMNYGCVNGDAGSAMLISRQAEGASAYRIVAIESVAASSLELMHRSGIPATPGPGLNQSGRVSLKTTKKSFLEEFGSESFTTVSHESLLKCIQKTISGADAEQSGGQIKAIALPRLSGNVRDDYANQLGPIFPDAQMLWQGDKTGHLGCTDIAANLQDMRSGADLSEGDMCIVVNAGAGYTWSAILLELIKPTAHKT